MVLSHAFQQTVIWWEVTNSNLHTAENDRPTPATRNTGTATLQGTVTASTVKGLASFSNLAYNVAETITIRFAATGLSNVVSDAVVVGPGVADRLAFTTQPGGVTRVGSPFAEQPVISSRDAFGNLSTVG